MSEEKPLICVVDDDEGVNAVLSEFLEAQGYDVKSFLRPAVFLEAYVALPRCDLVISDINMPGLSGYDLCRALRKDAIGARVPIILVTGSEVQSEKAKGLEAGADDFIGKPWSSKELLAKVRSLLGIRRQELETFGELLKTKGLNQELNTRLEDEVLRAERLEQLRRFLSPNLASLLAIDSQQALLKPHRAEVTVFFADLRNFTSFSQDREAEEVMEVLSRYYTIVGDAAIRHKGTLGHLAGDGIMVFFNDPEADPDHKENALSMALEAREALILERETWRCRQYGIDFGMGLSTGFATLGAIGFDRFSQYSVIGPVTNLASRLCHAAVGGQILVSSRFLARLDAECEAEPLGDLALKGIEKCVSAHNVLTMRRPEKKSEAA